MAVVYGTTPDPEVLAAFESGAVRVHRWCDVYQADNVTAYRLRCPLVDGSVSVDFSRDERRNIDIILNDLDGELGYGPGFLWYDKIIKPYRGLQLPDKLIDGYLHLPGTAYNSVGYTRTALASMTHSEFAVRVSLNAIGVAQSLAGYAGSGGNLSLTSGNLLNLGIRKTVSGVIGGADSSVAVPGLAINTKIWLRGVVTVSTANCQYYYSLSDTNDYDQVLWTQVGTNVTGTNAAGAVDFSWTGTVTFGSSNLSTAGFSGKMYAGAEVVSTAKVIEFDVTDQPQGSATFIATTGQVMDVNRSTTAFPAGAQLVAKTTLEGDIWVTGLGEFMPDVIETPRFPSNIHVTGRDFTKKMMNDRFTVTTSFAAGANVGTTIQTIATNAGITKFSFVTVTNVLGAVVTFEKNTSRWEACKQLAKSISCDLYFDNNGYLTLTPMVDPITAQLAYTFQTGTEGNLVDFVRSTNDSRLYNDVLVYGDSPDFPLVYANVTNTAPSSPTRIAAIGRRTYSYASQFFTSNAQCLAYAQKLLAVVALEQYDMNITSIVIPWLEAGKAVELLLPDAAVGDPTRFLLTAFTIPLMLGPMSGTAKRITIVS